MGREIFTKFSFNAPKIWLSLHPGQMFATDAHIPNKNVVKILLNQIFYTS